MMTSGNPAPGDVVRLRAFRPDDAPDLVAGCGDTLTQRFLPLLPSPYTHADAMSWISHGSTSASSSGGAAYALADPQTDRLIGGGGYGREHNGAAEIGYWVAPWARDRGVATAAVRAIVAQAFEQGIARLSLKTDFENTPSQRVALATGFTRESVERGGSSAADGTRRDLIVWARLATDSGDPRPRLLPDLPGHRAGHPGELSDGVVTLRPLQPADAEETLQLRRLPDVVATSVVAERVDSNQVAEGCARAEAAWLAGQRADFTVRDAATGAYTGELGLYYFLPVLREAMIGYSMLPQWRGRGYITRAARLVANWAFAHTNIVRLVAGTVPDNIGSQRVLERVGFVREGYQRARLPGPDGTRVDDLLYALLPDALTPAPPA